MLSPEITLISTSFSLNHNMVSLTSGLIVSLKICIATKVTSLGTGLSLMTGALALAKTITRKPLLAYSFTLFKIS